MIATSRRSFITGLVSFIAAPAIVRAGSLMPVKVMTGPTLDDYARIVYGRSPAMIVLQELEEIRARINAMFFVDILSVQRGAEHFPSEQHAIPR